MRWFEVLIQTGMLSPKFKPKLWGSLSFSKHSSDRGDDTTSTTSSELRSPYLPPQRTSAGGSNPEAPKPPQQEGASVDNRCERQTQPPTNEQSSGHSIDLRGLGVLDGPSGTNQNNVYEAPLPRPIALLPKSKINESPLKRPKIIDEDLPFPGVRAAIAVDVSGSTAGYVLEQEKHVIRTICEGLTSEPTIIPWSHTVEPILRPSELDRLDSEGGTEPDILNQTQTSKETLQQCSAWFLLTDGDIDDDEIRKFSLGISGNGLHGTASIIILFGYKTTRPVQCNISVGLSVFSTTPDCLFVFHDIDSGEAYVLQSKGAFNVLLPVGCAELLLHERTLWSHLPKLSYSSLFQIRVPWPKKLKADDFRLQSKRTINLEDVYQNRVDAETVTEILDNDDNLKSLLLTAQLRGHDNDIKRWISGQAIPKKDVLSAPRVDVGSEALLKMRILLKTTAAGKTSHNVEASLRGAHNDNWDEFVSNMDTENKKVSKRELLVGDALDRIESNRSAMNDELKCYSPTLLAPVTPGGSRMAFDPSQSYFVARDFPRAASRFKTDLLFMPGYRYQHAYGDSFRRTCPFCKEPDSIMVLLLKKPPKDFQTYQFPQPESRTSLTCPLAFGTFPETDIVSTSVACDACAYTLVSGKLSVDEEEFVSGIPLIQAAFSGESSAATLAALDTAFEKRFNQNAVYLVFFAVLYCTRHEAANDSDVTGVWHSLQDRKLLIQALRYVISILSDLLSVPLDLQMKAADSSPQKDGQIQGLLALPQAVSRGVLYLSARSPALLQYPIGGFVVMIEVMLDCNLEPISGGTKIAVWQRFLYHLVEKHCSFAAQDTDTAVAAIREIALKSKVGMSGVPISTNSTGDIKPIQETNVLGFESSDQQQSLDDEGERQNLIIPSLVGTYLLSEEDLTTFERLGLLFDSVKEKGGGSLTMFFEYLAELPTLDGSIMLDPMEIFNNFRESHPEIGGRYF